MDLAADGILIRPERRAIISLITAARVPFNPSPSLKNRPRFSGMPIP
jgi:hypothetical protein